HGGSVSAASPGVDKGAEFTLVLPLDSGAKLKDTRALPPADEREAADKLPHTLDGLSVLIVDDETDTVELIAELLRHCGAEVFTASSAPDALQTFHKHKP